MMHSRHPHTRHRALSQRVGAACAPWTLLLPDAAEGLLSEVEERALEQHLLGCPTCSEELLEAQRGLAWLTVLKDEVPEPPERLLSDILARTTGLEEVGVSLPALRAAPVLEAALPVHSVWSWLRGDPGTWSTLMQPRLAMTGAMAFFSICLTLNLVGVSVTHLEAQRFRNAGLHRTVATKGASLVRSIQGLRVVYRVESRVNEMRAQVDTPENGGQ